MVDRRHGRGVHHLRGLFAAVSLCVKSCPSRAMADVISMDFLKQVSILFADPSCQVTPGLI